MMRPKITIPAAVVAAVLLAFIGGEMFARSNTPTENPTAAELFKLRSDCAQIGQAKLKRLSNGADELGYEVATRYDPITSRCYVELNWRRRKDDPEHRNLSGVDLYDGQSNELLADVSVNRDGTNKVGHVWDQHHHRSHNDVYFDAIDYINRLMVETDRERTRP
jgi:hypothetical protein